MQRQRGRPRQSGADRGRGDSSSSTARTSLRASGSGSGDAETPRRFLHGDEGDPVAAAHSDLFPTREGLQRAVPEGAVSGSQGSTFHWHRGSSEINRRLSEDFAATVQMSEAESLPDASHGILTGAPGMGEGEATCFEETELVPGTLVLWSPTNSEDAGTRLAVITATAIRERESSPRSPWWDYISIYDGEKEHALPADPLPSLKRVPMEVPRALMPALASTAESQPPITPTADWSWLSSLEGIDHAIRLELPVSKEAIPHIIGSKGRTIRALEEKFGVVIGVMDVPEVGALVTFLGPQVPVLWAKVAVELLARGARSALARLQWSPG